MFLNDAYLRFSIMFICGFLLLGCNSEVEIATSNEAEVRPVKLLHIGSNQNSRLLSFPAVIQAGRSSNLAFQVGGVVSSVNIIESQMVNKGDVLASLDPKNHRVQLDVAQAQFDKSNSEYIRTETLFKKNIISRIKFEALKAERDINEAKLKTAQKALNDTKLLAPYSGNISKIDLTTNQTVQQGESVIGMLALATLEAKINLPSAIVATANNDQSPVYIVLNAAPQRKIPAYMKEVSLEADTESQTYSVTFNFSPQEDLNILPGMNARVFFIDPSIEEAKQVISIPMTAIHKQDGSLHVWVLNEETMTVSKRKVTIADGVGENLMITSGLEKGETIITAGVASLSEGMEVRPWVKN